MIWVTSASPPPARRWGQPSDPNRIPDFYERFADHPYRAMALNGWPIAVGLLAFAVLFAFFFPLLSDFWPHGEVARRYGVFDEERGFAHRGTFFADPDGIVRWGTVGEPGQARDFSGYHATLARLIGA